MLLRQIRARRRFKAIVRLVIANRAWLVEADPKEGRIVYSKKRKSELRLSIKALLNKQAAYRTEEEKMLIYRVIGGFKCFRKYPEQVKMMLAGSTYFAYFGPDRVIAKQNHTAQALYFVISGEVSVSVDEWDEILQEDVRRQKDILVPGDVFGENSLLNDEPREFTITTLTAVEFLLLYREDFNVILKDSVKKEWDFITAALRSFTYFDSWDSKDITDCCMVAKVSSYERDDTILGDGKGNKNAVYFVLKGSCRVIEHILVDTAVQHDGAVKYSLRNIATLDRVASVHSLSKSKSVMERKASMHMPGKSRLSFTSGDDLLQARSRSMFLLDSSVDTKFLQVCIFSEKACFGLGERMDRRRIVALTKVKCLLVPRYFIMTRGESNIWKRIQMFLEKQIPTTQEIFTEFQEQTKWRDFKNDMVRRLLKMPYNVPQNIPYSIRIREDFEYNQAKRST